MPFSPGPLRLQAAVHALYSGGVVACPTEAVWGLSCDPGNEFAVTRLLELKHRPLAKGLILVAASQSQFGLLLADLPIVQSDRLSASWPGPTTWLLPHRDLVPTWVHGEHDTVAVRVSDHPVVQALCQAWGGPLVSTSANPAGRRAARELFQVKRYFGDKLDYVLPGTVGGIGRPTSIKDLTSGQIIRA
ncbi:MAG: tRNA threonylcarbamoyladenosine biosynthesis protein RimN [Gammaproteobacteria bacterium]|nr:MAG: tRNA threonylcarbamoyladenosine biosynthesis protein RimN [Gammaproteobacteria bacterium]RLA59402.1 MAG: tRNA threonylcarbamoyladenosine biosynthesis protein RimN [Gammaproteobacteria bacterium]